MIKKYVLCAFLLWIAQESKGIELPITTASKVQIRPSVASSGTNYLAVWWDNHNSAFTGSDLWGRIISIDGTPQDSFPVCTLSQHQVFPEVAWGNNRYLITWMVDDSKLSKIYGQFADIDGNLIGTTFLIIDNLDLPWGLTGNDVESNGNNFLVVSTKNGGASNTDIVGRIVNDVDDFGGPVFTICDVPDTQFAPKVVGVDSNYLVAWPDFRTGNWNTYGQRVSPSGTPLIGGNFSIISKSVPQRRLALASNDTCVLIAWEENHGPWVGWDIHGSILDTAMKVLHSDIVISMEMWDQRLACACWHPKTSKFIVGWHDYRAGGKANIWIRKVNKDAIFDSEKKITTRSVEQREPDIACSNECFLIVWEDYQQGDSNIDIYGYVPGCTGKEEDYRLQIPDSRLNAYPNPFVSFVKFIGAKEGVKIYDIQGRLVKELNANQRWYGKGRDGREVPSGTYFVHPVRSSLPVQKIIKL